MTKTMTIGDRKLSFRYSKELQAQADWLEGVLADIAKERGNDFFAPDRTIQLGWSTLKLVEVKGTLQLQEPDFDGDPEDDTRNQLGTTLTVIAQQNDVVNPLGVTPVPIHFLEKVVFVEGAMEEEEVFFQRSELKEGDSGWTLKLLDNPKQDGPYDWIFVYDLLQIRPEAMKILTLPVGYIAVFLGETLDAILDENDRKVYTAS